MDMPSVDVTAVTLYEANCRTVEINCPYCHLTHKHEWPNHEVIIGLRIAPCDRSKHYDINTPRWHRLPKAVAQQPVLVLSDAFDDPANNWEE